MPCSDNWGLLEKASPQGLGVNHPRLTWAHRSSGLWRVCCWWQPWASHSANSWRDLSRIWPATSWGRVRFARQMGGCTGAATAIPGGLQFPRSFPTNCWRVFPGEQGKNMGTLSSLFVHLFAPCKQKVLFFHKVSLRPTTLAWSSVQLSLILFLQFLK